MICYPRQQLGHYRVKCIFLQMEYMTHIILLVMQQSFRPIYDNPTYNDIMQLSPDEKKLWDNAMIKEMKSLGALNSFKLVSEPRGANVL